MLTQKKQHHKIQLDLLTQRLGVTMSALSLGKGEKVLGVKEGSEGCSLRQGSNLRDGEEEKVMLWEKKMV